ncbi:WhiB family transcriptional regulator [Catenulispora rubra]|uniref:WhiB family transcriptional regulator n=1 Tax=Catenulispora rubra TaxID=280293 RepID=UPI0018923B0E|nr:WhiB family transcriptional regulator [Catenulispora rubra]
MNGSEPRPIAALWVWQESAACRHANPSVFYSPPGERGEARRRRENRAREICDGCPVRVECARFALSIGEEHGFWGGMTDRERIKVLRRPRVAARGSSGKRIAEATRDAVLDVGPAAGGTSHALLDAYR